MEKKVTLFRSLRGLLKGQGRIVNLVSAPDIYLNEWASFEDILWTDADYHEVYQRAGLIPLETYRPLAKQTEPFAWVSETTIAPWVIYVLGPAP